MAGDNQIAPDSRVRFSAQSRPLMWLGAAFVITALVLIPTLGVDRFTVTLLTEAFIFGIWAMSLDLLLGYTGLVSFGHAAAFGLGTYVAGYFAREVTADFAATLFVTIGAVALTACVVNIVLVRASGIAFAILSLVVSQVFFQIAVAWREVTDGMDGLIGVPAPTLLGYEVVDTQEFYWLTLAILVIMFLLLRWLVTRDEFNAMRVAGPATPYTGNGVLGLLQNLRGHKVNHVYISKPGLKLSLQGSA